MDKNVCKKNFPKDFVDETIPNCNGYPLYRRRNTTTVQIGIYLIFSFFTKKIPYSPSFLIKGNHQVDNSWVVPYNPYLTLKYNCHINVEVASSIKCVKYLFKYIYKGYDCADVKITTYSADADTNSILQYNEIDRFVNTRYISAPEAVHRLFEFRMQGKSHTVIILAIHLPLENHISFVPGEESLALERNPATSLTAWFELNKTDPDARNLTYCEIPDSYVFNDNKQWQKRKQGKNLYLTLIYIF